jgi:hypothetical protein
MALSVTSVELLPAASPATGQPPAAEAPRPAIMDIWAAAAHGNVEAIRRHLAAGWKSTRPLSHLGSPRLGPRR